MSETDVINPAAAELALVGGEAAEQGPPKLSDLCSTALRRQLESQWETGHAVRYALDHAEAREFVAEAKTLVPQLQAALAPAGRDGVLLQLWRLGKIFGPPPGRTSKHWEELAEEYVEVLEGFPWEALVRGADAYRDDEESKFFPLPGQLKGKVVPFANALMVALYRAKEIARGEARATAPKEDAATRAKVLEDMRQLSSGLKAKAQVLQGPPPMRVGEPMSAGVKAMLRQSLQGRRAPAPAPAPSDDPLPPAPPPSSSGDYGGPEEPESELFG